MSDAQKIFAIGDVHGCATELRMLLNKLPIEEEDTVVFLGDYVDRGMQSRQVIDTILSLRENCNVVCLMGNHESLFLDFLESPGSEGAGMFIYNGGSATLASYADERGEYNIPEAHYDFLCRLSLYYETDDYFFVHAGVPDIPLSNIDPVRHQRALLWSRGHFLRSTYDWEKLVVHGHTPVKEVDVRKNRINLDTACVFNYALTAVELPARKFYSVAKQQKPAHVYLRDRSSRRIATRFEGTLPVYVTRDNEVFEFETIDYSPKGMLIRDISHRVRQVLESDAPIAGMIGRDDETLISFSGRVVRVQKKEDGLYYAVDLDRAETKDPREVVR